MLLLDKTDDAFGRVLESVTEELENVDIDEDEPENVPDPKLLKSQFSLFAKFGDTGADGKSIKVNLIKKKTKDN